MDELLTNYDLIYLCKKFKINLIQCESKNKINIKPIKYRPCCYIINLDNFDGSHWTALFCYMNQAVYFDSYGAIMPNEIIKFCNKYSLRLTYNQTQIQHLKSVLCGYFCLYFLYFMSSNVKQHNMNKILNYCIEPFDTIEQENNDKILKQLIKNIYKLYH